MRSLQHVCHRNERVGGYHEEVEVTTSEREPGSGNRNRQQLEDLFAIDFRGLAAFRVIIGAVLMVRSAYGLTGYWNFFPAEEWTWKLLGYSIHVPEVGQLGNLLCWFALFCGGTLLVIGRWTWITTLMCWALMLVHVHGYMNTSQVDIGKYLNLAALLWMLLLPMSVVASWSNRCDRYQVRGEKRFLSFATAALLIQPLLVYFSAGITKSKQDWFLEGDALFHLMHTHWATPTGRWFIQYPGLLNLLTRGAMFMEIVVPLFFFWPWRGRSTIRTVLVPIFIVFHLSMSVMVNLDVIPLVCIAFIILFLPTSAWDRMMKRPPAEQVLTQSDPIRGRHWIAGICLLLVAVSFSLSMAHAQNSSKRVAYYYDKYPRFGLFQGWVMFHQPSKLRELEEQNLPPVSERAIEPVPSDP